MVRENVHAASAIERFVSTTIGTGIVPISQHPDPATKKLIQDTFLAWTDECDATGTCDFYGLQSQVCRAERQDGEVFTRLRPRRPQDGLKVPLQLQVIESDFVSFENTDAEFETTRAGIVFDAIGKRKAYRMYRDHPGEMFSGITGGGTLSTVPANQILHTFRVKRPGQLRGEPWLTPAIVTLYEIEQTTDAVLLRWKVANLLAFFIRKVNNGEESPTLNETDQGDGTALAGIQPGSVNYLDENEEVSFNTPADPGTNATDLIKCLLRSVAAALGGLTYEQLSGNLEGVNLSSIRAGMLEARRWCEAYQHQVMVFQWCRPVWKAWIETAVLAGVFSASQYAAHPEWFTAIWHPHRWPWTEPVKDLEEAVGKIRAGLSTRPAEVAKLGEDSAQVDAENAEANQRADTLRVRYDSDGRFAKNAAATPPQAGDPNQGN
jgi:lambda family phage portal protein